MTRKLKQPCCKWLNPEFKRKKVWLVNSGGGHRCLSSEWEGIGTNSVLEGQMGIFLLHEFPGLSSTAHPAVIDQRTLQEETALCLHTCRGHVDCLQFLLQLAPSPTSPTSPERHRSTKVSLGRGLSPGKVQRRIRRICLQSVQPSPPTVGSTVMAQTHSGV